MLHVIHILAYFTLGACLDWSRPASFVVMAATVTIDVVAVLYGMKLDTSGSRR